MYGHMAIRKGKSILRLGSKPSGNRGRKLEEWVQRSVKKMTRLQQSCTLQWQKEILLDGWAGPCRECAKSYKRSFGYDDMGNWKPRNPETHEARRFRIIRNITCVLAFSFNVEMSVEFLKSEAIPDNSQNIGRRVRTKNIPRIIN